MENLVIIQNERDSSVKIFDASYFKELNVCECYNEYGQLNDCTETGCCSLDNYYYRREVEKLINEDDYETNEDYTKNNIQLLWSNRKWEVQSK